jgi:RNA recognition motif-containing protein
LAPDGRSKGWGTAVFATPQEAQNAIDTYDGWEVDGRIIKVRWDKYQGSTNQPSPQLVPTAGLSSPQMMHAQLSPAQTPRPNDYVAIASNQAQQNWQSQFLAGTIRPMQSMQPMSAPSMQPAPPVPMTAHGHYQPAFAPQFPNHGPPVNTQIPPGPYPGMLFNTQGGQWYPNYTATLPPLAPQVRLPSSAETFNFVPQPGHTQNVESSNTHNVYGI